MLSLYSVSPDEPGTLQLMHIIKNCSAEAFFFLAEQIIAIWYFIQ